VNLVESAELQSVAVFTAMIQAALDDATTRLGVALPALDVYSFRQTWPDASCGFGGIAAQVLTDAQTVVAGARDASRAVVYVRGEFAYVMDRPNQAFWDAVRARQLPGAASDRAHLGD
jgi:hypothetical protein